MAVIEFDTKELTDFLNTLGARIQKNFDSKTALKESGDLIADIIRKRTLSGIRNQMESVESGKQL